MLCTAAISPVVDPAFTYGEYILSFCLVHAVAVRIDCAVGVVDVMGYSVH